MINVDQICEKAISEWDAREDAICDQKCDAMKLLASNLRVDELMGINEADPIALISQVRVSQEVMREMWNAAHPSHFLLHFDLTANRPQMKIGPMDVVFDPDLTGSDWVAE